MRKNIIILILYVVGMFAALAPYFLIEQLFAFEDPYQIIAFISTYVTIILILSYFIFVQLKKDFKPFFKNILRNIGIIAAIFVLSFILTIVANLIVQLLGITDEAVNQGGLISMIENATTVQLVVLALLFCLLVPIIEELVFRKALYGLVKDFILKIAFNDKPEFDKKKANKYGSISAIIISGLIFGLIHVSGDYIYLIHYGGAGIILAASYYLSNENIYVPLTVHIAQNTMGVIQIIILMNSGLL